MATLRALQCPVAVADSGSVTQAARLLHSSQPAVSHQLAVLERETRTVLLRREALSRFGPAGFSKNMASYLTIRLNTVAILSISLFD